MRGEGPTSPIVFVLVSYPVGNGFVDSLARPGGNITGFINIEASIGGKWVELLKEIAPNIKRAAVLFNPDTATYADFYLTPIKAAAASLSIEAVPAPVRAVSEIEPAFFQIDRRCGRQCHCHAGRLYRRQPPKRLLRKPNVIAFQTVYPYRYMAQDGGLISYGVDTNDLYRPGAQQLTSTGYSRAPNQPTSPCSSRRSSNWRSTSPRRNLLALRFADIARHRRRSYRVGLRGVGKIVCAVRPRRHRTHNTPTRWRARRALHPTQSQRFDRHYTGHRLDGAGDLRRDPEASRQLDLDLGAVSSSSTSDFAVGRDPRRCAPRRSAPAAAPRSRSAPGRAGRRATPSAAWRPPRRAARHSDAGAHVVGLQFGGQREQDRPARLQDVTELRQPFGEHHRLEMAGRIRQLDDAHLAAGAGAALEPRHHRAGDPAAAGAGLHGAGELGP